MVKLKLVASWFHNFLVLTLRVYLPYSSVEGVLCVSRVFPVAVWLGCIASSGVTTLHLPHVFLSSSVWPLPLVWAPHEATRIPAQAPIVRSSSVTNISIFGSSPLVMTRPGPKRSAGAGDSYKTMGRLHASFDFFCRW